MIVGQMLPTPSLRARFASASFARPFSRLPTWIRGRRTDSSATLSERWNWTGGPAIVLYIALADLLLHLAVAGRYDFFRDELYYIACSKHLALGYVDQPPLIAIVVWFTRHLLGNSLWVLRLPAAFAGFVLVRLTGRITREFGGGRFAQALAATCVSLALVYVVNSYLMTMNSFTSLFWMGCAFILIRILKTGDARLWVWFGLLAGLGLENKYDLLVFGVGIVVGLLLTAERRQFRSDWLWIGGLVALLIFLPNLVWQTANGFPFLQLMHNIRANGRDLWPGAFGFFVQQVILMNLLSLPVWLAGLWFFFPLGALWEKILGHLPSAAPLPAAPAPPEHSADGRLFRPLGWTFVTVYLAFLLLHGKSYYVSPVYPLMFAAGAVVLERWFRRPARSWLRPLSIAAVVFSGALYLPAALPLFPVPTLEQYIAWLPLKAAATERSHLAAALPQYFSDQFGWRGLTQAAAAAYWSIPESERSDAAIVGNNYGESAAIDFYGPQYGLPPSIGVHQNYWLWGPRDYTGSVLVVLGDNYDTLSEECAHVALGPIYQNPFGLEQDPVLVCYGFRWNLQTDWFRFKKWD